jgi:hypothetical protein
MTYLDRGWGVGGGVRRRRRRRRRSGTELP